MAELLLVEEARDRVLAAVPAALPRRASRSSPHADVSSPRRWWPRPTCRPGTTARWTATRFASRRRRGAAEEAPVRLAVTGEVAAGRAPDVVVEAGTAVRIATGAPLPPGADAVVQVELTTPARRGRQGRRRAVATRSGRVPAVVLVHAALRRRHERAAVAAGDLRAGATILEPGRAIGPAEVALVAGAGRARREVHRRPRVAVISTGDELRPAGTDLGPAGIPDSNGPVARGPLRGGRRGCAPPRDRARRPGGDDADARARRSPRRDLVVVSGGVSVGPTTSSGRPSRPSAPSTCGASRCSRASHSRSARRPPARRRHRQPGACSWACPGTRSRRSSPSSSSCAPSCAASPAVRMGPPAPGDLAVLEEPVTKSPGRRGLHPRRRPCGAPGRARRCAMPRAASGSGWPGGRGATCSPPWRPPTRLAIVPESVDALPAGAPVELWWLDRP